MNELGVIRLDACQHRIRLAQDLRHLRSAQPSAKRVLSHLKARLHQVLSRPLVRLAKLLQRHIHDLAPPPPRSSPPAVCRRGSSARYRSTTATSSGSLIPGYPLLNSTPRSTTSCSSIRH